MSDPYRIHEAGPAPAGDSAATRGRTLRGVLWLVLVASAAANATTSLGGLDPLLSVTFGLATLLCVAGLIVHHVRGRRR
jgi:hypothetical protein